MATLKEIAADIGVSHTLVSRVLSGRMGTTRVSESTRQAILRRAEELDFQPNSLATALKEGRKGVVGVYLHHIGTPGSELSYKFVQTASHLLAERGERLLLRLFRNSKDFLDSCTKRVINSVDGLIVGGSPHPDLVPVLMDIHASGVPVVCAFHHQEGLKSLPNFEVDHEMQAFLVTQHLLEQGCRRLAHFQKDRMRRKGFLRAHQEAGVKADEALRIKAKDYHYDDGKDCMSRLLGSDLEYDGIVTESDAHAFGALNIWIHRNKQLEDWPRIVGIDNSPIAEQCVIPLTSVTGEVRQTASSVVEALFELRDGKTVKSRRIQPRLVVRESSTRRSLGDN